MIVTPIAPPIRPDASTGQDDAYQLLTLRNRGYVEPEEQERIRRTSLLIAGCGLGSVVAEVALRTGFERLVLADGDQVAAHNLNRQVYTRRDVGQSKAACLERRLRSIYPEAVLTAQAEMLTPATIPAVVAAVDVVVDCIDFLDVRAILALHHEARRQGKYLISTFTMGWGAAALVFAPDGISLEDMVAPTGKTPASHGELIQALAYYYRERIPTYVHKVLASLTGELIDGKPCPAPQLAVATFMLASLAVTAAVRLAQGLPVTLAPTPLYFDCSTMSSQDAPA